MTDLDIIIAALDNTITALETPPTSSVGQLVSTTLKLLRAEILTIEKRERLQ